MDGQFHDAFMNGEHMHVFKELLDDWSAEEEHMLTRIVDLYAQVPTPYLYALVTKPYLYAQLTKYASSQMPWQLQTQVCTT